MALPIRKLSLAVWLALLVTGGVVQAQEVVYQLDTKETESGKSFSLKSVYMNSSLESKEWLLPQQIVLIWRDSHGREYKTIAKPQSPTTAPLIVTPQQFASINWVSEVPDQAAGVMTVHVDGDSSLLALKVGSSSSALASYKKPSLQESGYSTQAFGASSEEHEMRASNNFKDSISPYEPIYFSVGSRGGNTARFQLSLKYRVFKTEYESAQSVSEGWLGAIADRLYLGYTQTSMWDLYKDSKPFRDTSYRPSIFLYEPDLWQSASQKWQLGMNTGFEHESNGKDGEDSRSIDIAYVRPILSYKSEAGDVFSFAPRMYGYIDKDENPAISDYRGHVDWYMRWKSNKGTILSATFKQGSEGGSRQVDLAYPLRKFANLNGYLHVQYFNGYGETMLEYNIQRRSQIRVGLMVIP